MSDYTITFTRSSRKELEALDTKIVNRLFPKIENLAIEPRPASCRKLTGNKTRSARRFTRAFLALRVQGIYPALDQGVSALRAATPWTPKTQGVRSKLRSI